MLLQHFCSGLSKESTIYIDPTAGGSFLHKTTTKERETPYRILKSTNYVDVHIQPLKVEDESSHKEPSSTESKSLPSTFLDSVIETSLEQRILGEEEILLPGVWVEFKEYTINDYGNNLNYF